MSRDFTAAPTIGGDSLWRTIQPWVVCFVAALFFFYNFIQMNMFNAIGPALIQSFHLSEKQLGSLSAVYFYADVLFLFAAGIILDRFSTRRIILLMVALTTVATLGFSLVTQLWQAEAFRFLIGLAAAFSLLSCVRLATRWFPPHRMALVIGLIVTFAMIGGMVAQTPLTLLISAVGWRSALTYDALLGAAIVIAVFLVVKDHPRHKILRKQDQHDDNVTPIAFWPSLVAIIKNTQNWLGGLYASMINLPIFILGATWGSLYLVQVDQLSREDASFVTSMIFVGMIIGSPVVGWLSDRIRLRKLPMIIGAAVSLLIVLALMYIPHLHLLTLMALFFALGFAISTQIIAYPLIAESNPQALTGTAEGLASMLIMAGGFTIQLFPVLLDWHWNHHLLHHFPIYSTGNFDHALDILPIAFMISFVLSLFIKETRCKNREQLPLKQESLQDTEVSKRESSPFDISGRISSASTGSAGNHGSH